MGFEDTAFRTHSCRRGGATALALARLSLQEIMMQGRWTSESSCKEYIKKGEVLLVRFLAGIPPVMMRRIELLANLGERVKAIQKKRMSPRGSAYPRHLDVQSRLD